MDEGQNENRVPEEAQMMNGLPPELMEQIKTAYQEGVNVLYDEKVFEQLIKGIDTQDPVQILALALLKIVDGIDQKMGGLNIQVLLGTAMFLLGDVVDALQRTGRPPLNPQQIEQALSMMIHEWLKAHGDRIPPEQMQAFIQQVGQMPAAEQAPNAGQMPARGRIPGQPGALQQIGG